MEFITAYLTHQSVFLGNICTYNSIDPSTTSRVLIPAPAPPRPPPPPARGLSRYENQKRRDWNTFCQYLNNHWPPLSLSICNASHVLEFLKFLDQFGKTKVHFQNCPFFGMPDPPAACSCPLRQAWGSLDALVGRLRAAYEEHVGGGKKSTDESKSFDNPFGAKSVRLFLRDVRDFQSKSRGISYQKKKRKRSSPSKKQHKNPSSVYEKTNLINPN